MAGGTREHNLIAGNIVREVGNVLRDRPCEVYPSDMRIWIPEAELYTYPDASVVCEPPRFKDDVRDTLLNPKVIFEVLSGSTESYDRGERFQHYRTLSSLVGYILVSQTTILIERFERHDDGSWLLRESRAGDRLELPSLGCTIDVDELYLKVFPQPSADQGEKPAEPSL